MAEIEMYDYLPALTPDYTSATLSVRPDEVLVEIGGYKDLIFVGDDQLSEERIALSDDLSFNVTLKFNAKSKSDIGTVLDFFYNTSKGYGRTRTFYWAHPTDGHTYIVRFNSETLSRSITRNSYQAIEQFELKVLGKFIPDEH